MSLPPKRNHPARAPLIALGVIVALAVSVAVVFAVMVRSLVFDADDVSVGDCLRVTDAGNGAVKPRKADCDGADFTFYVASKSTSSGTACASRDYSRVSFEGGGGLCLAPNWRAGHCYEVPRATSPGATYLEKGCSTVPADRNRPIYEITDREDGTTDPRCDGSDEAVSFALPKPVGYCYTLASDMPA